LILRFPGPVRLEDLAPDRRLLVNRFSAQSGIRYLAAGTSQEKDLSWLDGSSNPSLSADGQWLLFSEFGEAAGSQGAVYLRKTDGSPAVRLGTGGALAFSPDGKWALTMARSRQELALLPVGVGGPRTIALPANFERYETGTWLRDGRLLVTAIERGHDPRLYVLPIGGQPHPISPEGLVSRPVVSPDDRRVLISINDKTVSLNVDGGEALPIVAIEAGEAPVAWSADGQSVLVSRDRDLSTRVSKVNLKTGTRTAWKTLAPTDLAGMERVYGLQISADEKSYAYAYARQLGELYLVAGLR
jgi:Tol biopolymer transport system component